MYCAKQRQTLTECVFLYSILFIRDNCRKEPHKRGSLYFIVQYTPRLSIYILDLCFIYNKPILCVVSPNQTCIIACLTVAKIPMSSDVDFEMTRNIKSVQQSNKDLAILDEANPLRNILPLGIQKYQLQNKIQDTMAKKNFLCQSRESMHT